jgi:HAD superfamily hydrolase (TIGR01509 family)
VTGPDLPAAVLWDMDGLLVDSEPLWTVAEGEICAGWGVAFSPRTKAAMIGRRLDESVPILIAAAGVVADPAEVAHRLMARMVELFAAGVSVRPGARALLEEVAAAGVPQALVSSSLRALVDALPSELRARFAVTVAGDEVALAKPDPAGYLAAAAALGVAAADCVVLEDSAAGARAGAAAGCRVLVVPSAAAVAADPDWELAATLEGVGLAGLAALGRRRPATPGSRAARR